MKCICITHINAYVYNTNPVQYRNMGRCGFTGIF
jgi:hypothetical protein